MSFISMIGMEIAVNTAHFMITGGKAVFEDPMYWMALIIALIAGFIAPLPYNYYKLAKYDKACHRQAVIVYVNQINEIFRIFEQVKKITSIFLSLLIFVSSMGITFSTHYCMGHAVDSELMIGMHELSCGMMDTDASCETTGTNIMAPGCCDNEFVSIEIEDDYQVAKTKYSFESNFLFAFAFTYLFDHLHKVERSTAHADHHPPPLEQDYQSLYQSFLL